MSLLRPAIFTVILLHTISTITFAQQSTPIPYAHAHNDYEHERPLLDALAHGFTSVEADVWAIDGELYVYHNKPATPDATRTLRRLYLEPLNELIQRQNGQVYLGYNGHFQLMIDLKTDAESTYPLIQAQLQAYTSLFTRIENGRDIKGAVMVFLSGNRPMETILAADTHIAKLDGRPEDLSKGYPAEKMPVISQSYGKILDWPGEGKLPKQQARKLRTLLKAVHREGKQLRLWAMPANEQAWATYLRLGMDWINADDLARLQTFYLQQQR